MAKFNGSLKEFEKFIGPSLRNIVQTKISRKYKKEIGKCENCKTKKNLEAAHIHGNERKTILKKSMEGNISENIIFDLDLLLYEEIFIKNHLPLNETFKVLCKKCHLEYDKKQVNIELTNEILIIEENDFKNWLIINKNYKKNVVQSRLSNCNIIEKHYGDLNKHFQIDGGNNLLELFKYSKDDERNNRPALHKIGIDGNIREGTATLKQALKLYFEFKKSKHK